MIPNYIIKQIYTEYFLKYMDKRAGIARKIEIDELAIEVVLEGKIEKIIKLTRRIPRKIIKRFRI